MSGETEQAVSGWTVDTLHSHLIQAVAALSRSMDQQFTMYSALLDERYQTQQRQVDAAFLAQSTAMATALTAAERAVAASREATEKAIDKAEIATEKRFGSVNEFRGQLADQAATMLTRNEANAVIAGLADKLNVLAIRLNELELRITSRLELSKGEKAGHEATYAAIYALAGFVAVVISIAATVYALRP